MTDYEARKQEIGKRIQQERERLHLTRKELLPKIYMSESSHKTLAAWENGDRLPDLDSIARMAELFGCDIGYLLCDYDEHTRDIADACEVTGLSAGAVENLKKYDERVVTYVSFLLETGLINRTGLKASQCIDTRLEISHYERDVMPSLTIPPEDEKRAWREWKFSDSYLDTASKRTKVLDEIQHLKEVYDARLWRCCKAADEAVVDFIDKEVDKWLTSKNAATKMGD